jgi:DNA-directed RNA polymerase subunit H (RpoH/RPB5)
MSINIEYNSKEINEIVCLNILKMLNRRKLVDNIETKLFDKILNQFNQKAYADFEINDIKYSIYIINVKITSISQGTTIHDFLINNLDTHKILILKEAPKKVLKQIITQYKNAEYFFEYEMMEDIPSKIFIPPHELLNKEEKKELLLKFNENELAEIKDYDPMVRHFNAKVGDIFRIIRPSLLSGTNIYYRRVSHAPLDLLYN